MPTSPENKHDHSALIRRRQQSLSSTDHLDPSCRAIVERYFSSEERQAHLEAGQKLLDIGQKNERLYYIDSGRIRGKMTAGESLEDVPLVILPGDLAGLRSFFHRPAHRAGNADRRSANDRTLARPFLFHVRANC